jgi:hypothetical protein
MGKTQVHVRSDMQTVPGPVRSAKNRIVEMVMTELALTTLAFVLVGPRRKSASASSLIMVAQQDSNLRLPPCEGFLQCIINNLEVT